MKGLVRDPLLRAHPLLSDGVVDLTSSSAFGRTLAYGSAEEQRWFERPVLVRVGVAGFVDVARATRQAAAGTTPVQVDIGVGLRFKIPGQTGVLRADIAHGLRDGSNALTFGWLLLSLTRRLRRFLSVGARLKPSRYEESGEMHADRRGSAASWP